MYFFRTYQEEKIRLGSASKNSTWSSPRACLSTPWLQSPDHPPGCEVIKYFTRCRLWASSDGFWHSQKSLPLKVAYFYLHNGHNWLYRPWVCQNFPTHWEIWCVQLWYRFAWIANREKSCWQWIQPPSSSKFYYTQHSYCHIWTGLAWSRWCFFALLSVNILDMVECLIPYLQT